MASRSTTWCILSPPSTMFVAEQVKAALERHFDRVDFSIVPPERFIHDFYIVLTANVYKRLPPPEKTFIYQLEQNTSTFWWNDEYLGKLKAARAVLDYSFANLVFLEKKGIKYPKTYYLPTGAIPNYKKELDTERKTIDILFYGLLLGCEKRTTLLEKLSSKRRVTIVQGIYGDDMAALIKKSRTVLNLHYYEPSILETTRINECLSLGTPVVSENSFDSGEYKELFDVVGFFKDGTREVNDIIDVIDRYQRTLPTRENLLSFAVKSQEKFFFMFDRFLVDQNLLPVSSLTKIPVDSNVLALSLPEITARRLGFLKGSLGSVNKFEGIRCDPGWKGCAHSYRLLAKNALDKGYDRLTIMEDDVLVLPNFAKRMDSIRKFLDLKQGNWDVFSGFIADVHDDTKILSVEDYEGVTFVTLDKMTSMVFNIYSKTGLEILSKWNPEAGDSSVNTVDRYMESKKGLRVVLAYPYLVGHNDAMASTLWGCDNTEYNDLIAKSLAKLSWKIQEFKKEPQNGN